MSPHIEMITQRIPEKLHPLSPSLNDMIALVAAKHFHGQLVAGEIVHREGLSISMLYTAIGALDLSKSRIYYNKLSYPITAKLALLEKSQNKSEFTRQKESVVFSEPVIRIQGIDDVYYLPIETFSGAMKVYSRVLKITFNSIGDIQVKIAKRGLLSFYFERMNNEWSEHTLKHHKFWHDEYPHLISSPPTEIARYRDAIICKVSDYPQGTVESWIESKKFTTNTLIYDFLRQLASMLQELHRDGFAVGDLKPSNLVVDKNQHYLICDIESMSNELNMILATTPEYRPPEGNRGAPFHHKVTAKADIWAFGKIISDLKRAFPTLLGTTLDAIEARCLSINPIERPSAPELFIDLPL